MAKEAETESAAPVLTAMPAGTPSSSAPDCDSGPAIEFAGLTCGNTRCGKFQKPHRSAAKRCPLKS